MRRWPIVLAPAGFLALLVLVVTRWTPLLDLDRNLATALNRSTAAHPALVTFWKVVTTAGQPLTFQVVAAVLALLLWLRARRVRAAIFVAATVLLAGLLSTLVKLAVGRDRPTVPEPLAQAAASSFPSGHALTSIVGVIVLLHVGLPRLRHRTPVVAVGAVIVLLVGFSRLALGVHYLSDVLAGWLLGITWVLLMHALLSTRRKREPGVPA